MSLSVDGFWKAGFWSTTFWADGFWYEGEPVPPEPPATTSFVETSYARAPNFAPRKTKPAAIKQTVDKEAIAQYEQELARIAALSADYDRLILAFDAEQSMLNSQYELAEMLAYQTMLDEQSLLSKKQAEIRTLIAYEKLLMTIEQNNRIAVEFLLLND